VVQLDYSLRESIDADLRPRAQVIASRVRSASTDGAVAGIPEEEQLAQVLGSDDRVLASTRRMGRSPTLSAGQLRDARRGPLTTERVLPGGGADGLRLLAIPVPTAGGIDVVVVGSSLAAARDARGDVATDLAIGSGVIVLVAGVGAWILSGAALRPVERMRRQVAAISERADSRLGVPSTRDEIAALARTMNDLLGRLEAAQARERRLVADTAHELRTPLAILQTGLELAQRPGRSRQDLAAAVVDSARETAHLTRLTEDLLFLARTDEHVPMLRLERHHLGPVLRTAIDAHRARADGAGVHLALSIDDDPAGMFDDARIRQAVDNLLDNALRVAPTGSTVQLRARCERALVVIEVADRGPGFPPGFLPNAFERFRRADAARTRNSGGAGLGLALVLAIAVAHGGGASAENREESGAVVRVWLPLVDEDVKAHISFS
jgi:two-component system, OmpR family, sensor kinase